MTDSKVVEVTALVVVVVVVVVVVAGGLLNFSSVIWNTALTTKT